MNFDFKVPSTIPQDLLLIQDLIGSLPLPAVTAKHVSDSVYTSDDSIASTDDEIESEDEVEADLLPRDEDNGVSAITSDSVLPSDSESDTTSSSDSEEIHDLEAPLPQRSADDVEDEESGTTTAVVYLQTKNEIIDTNIMVPSISEVDACDTLESVGEVMSIVGNIVIVRGLPVDHVKSLSEHALDAESLLVFEDRKVLGYIYETFGPTSQPLYQVKFNQHYPLDTNKIWLSREVFHVPQCSHFIFVNQLKKLRGSDASNIHDEEPADDEIEFSDDEKEAAFRAQHKRRRGQSVSSSKQSTPAPSRTHIDNMAQDTYHGSNPYDAHGPYDDDYHVTGPSRPTPIPYDDPYADVPTSDIRVHATEINTESGGEPNCESGRVGHKASRGHGLSRGTRGNGARNRQSLNTSERGYRNNSVLSRRRTFDPDTNQATSRMVECGTGYGQVGDAIAPHPFIHPPSNAWLSQETNRIPNYQQSFIQPHINPRFASAFGLDLPSGSAVPWASQNAPDHGSRSQQWVGPWTMHSNTGSEGDGDTYRPM